MVKVLHDKIQSSKKTGIYDTIKKPFIRSKLDCYNRLISSMLLTQLSVQRPCDIFNKINQFQHLRRIHLYILIIPYLIRNKRVFNNFPTNKCVAYVYIFWIHLLKQLFQYNETETLVIILADIATYSLTHDYEALPTCTWILVSLKGKTNQGHSFVSQSSVYPCYIMRFRERRPFSPVDPFKLLNKFKWFSSTRLNALEQSFFIPSDSSCPSRDEGLREHVSPFP